MTEKKKERERGERNGEKIVIIEKRKANKKKFHKQTIQV